MPRRVDLDRYGLQHDELKLQAISRDTTTSFDIWTGLLPTSTHCYDISKTRQSSRAIASTGNISRPVASSSSPGITQNQPISSRA
jgi:hypothetical protein